MSNAIGSVVSRVAVMSSNNSSLLRNGVFKELIHRGKITENIANFAKCRFLRVESAQSSAIISAKEKGGFQTFVNNFMKRLNVRSTSYASQILAQFSNRCLSTAVKGEEALNLKIEEKTTSTAAQPATPVAPIKKSEISYDELVSTFIHLEEKFLFDVREPTEISETGTIPHAVNIPLTQLKTSLQLEESEFITRFNIRKPTATDSNLIVFYGLSSVKGSSALEIAHKLGFKKARYYPGGFEEWKTKEAPYLI